MIFQQSQHRNGKLHLTQDNIDTLAHQLAHKIKKDFHHDMNRSEHTRIGLYGVPRGGVPVVYKLASLSSKFYIVNSPEAADYIIDDLIDSGATSGKYLKAYPGCKFEVLINKIKLTTEFVLRSNWLVFPWEEDSESSIKDNITRLLQYTGDDATREGLLETPNRVTKAFDHWFSGYGQDAAQILKVFEDGAEHYNQMVTVKDIPVYSKCEHHMADIFGTATISYIPNGKIVGLSKLSRLVNVFARRLQVQERLTQQIADALTEHLNPLGVGVKIKARHMCMESRGICQQGHHTITTALKGVMLDDPQARAEFLSEAS